MKALKIDIGGGLMLQPDATFESMAADIGGYIEPVRIPDTNALLLVDEDGLMKRVDVNPVASALVGRQIVGVAFLVGDGPDDFTDVPDDAVHSAELVRLRLSDINKRSGASGVVDVDVD